MLALLRMLWDAVGLRIGREYSPEEKLLRLYICDHRSLLKESIIVLSETTIHIVEIHFASKFHRARISQ